MSILLADVRPRCGYAVMSVSSRYLLWAWRTRAVDTVNEGIGRESGAFGHAWRDGPGRSDEVWVWSGSGLSGTWTIGHHITMISLFVFSFMMIAHSKRAGVQACMALQTKYE